MILPREKLKDIDYYVCETMIKTYHGYGDRITIHWKPPTRHLLGFTWKGRPKRPLVLKWRRSERPSDDPGYTIYAMAPQCMELLEQLRTCFAHDLENEVERFLDDLLEKS